MPYDPSKHHRRSIRLKDYDYSSPGYYFITSCTQHRICRFGQIVNGKVILNGPGNLVKEQWELLPKRFKNIRIDEFVVMPDHFHGILQIVSDEKSVGLSGINIVESSDINTVGTSDIKTVESFDINTVGAPLVGAPLQQFTESEEGGTIVKGQPQGITPTVFTANNTDKKTVGDIVGAFHSIVTVEYIRMVKLNKWPPFNKRIWQRNYWEHIIRNDLALFRIRNYIRNNPKNWDKDSKCGDHGRDVEE